MAVSTVKAIDKGFSWRRNVDLTPYTINNSAKITFDKSGYTVIVSNGATSGAGYIYILDNGNVIGSVSCPNGSGGLTYTTGAPVFRGIEYTIEWGGFSMPACFFWPFAD